MKRDRGRAETDGEEQNATVSKALDAEEGDDRSQRDATDGKRFE